MYRISIRVVGVEQFAFTCDDAPTLSLAVGMIDTMLEIVFGMKEDAVIESVHIDKIS